MNQLMGSQHIVAPDIMLRPIGTPTIGLPVPEVNGHRPHTWTVVPRHSSAAWMYVDIPAPRPAQPRGPGRLPIGWRFFLRSGCVGLTTTP
jgi:hypothetical protein